MSKLYDLLSAMCGKIKKPDWNQNDSAAADYVKNRPFYTATVETVLVEESTVSFSELSGGIYQGKFSSTFSPTIGETYKVSWDGTVYECVCVSMQGARVIGNASLTGAGSDSGEPFLMIVPSRGEIIIGSTETSDSHTFSIRHMVPQVVQIDEKYLPDTVATKSEVEFAQTTANAAQTTANAAQTTANAAQTTANAAKTAAENAKIDPISYNYCATLFSKHGKFIGWYDTMGTLQYESKSGSFFRSYFETTPLKYEDIPFNDFICTTYLNVGELPYSKYLLFLTKFSGVNGWGVEGVAIDSRGGTFYVKSPTVDKSTGEGLFLNFLPQKYMLINSSTANSTKKFKITVDDSGTLTATEVTA